MKRQAAFPWKNGRIGGERKPGKKSNLRRAKEGKEEHFKGENKDKKKEEDVGKGEAKVKKGEQKRSKSKYNF